MALDNVETKIRLSNREQRFIWMVLNYPLWKDMPDQPKWTQNSYENRSSWLRKYGSVILRAMKADGVVAPSTDVFCIPSMTDMMKAIRNNDEYRCEKYIGHLL